LNRCLRRHGAGSLNPLKPQDPTYGYLANLESAQNRRAYQTDLKSFIAFTGIEQPEEFRAVTRGHVLAWRAELERPELAGSNIRRKLSALPSVFNHLCNCNAVTHNPARGVRRPKVNANGKTPALGDGQARALIDAPHAFTLKGKRDRDRDRAILAVLLFHGLRR
jgi:site-specific recombinase XerD